MPSILTSVGLLSTDIATHYEYPRHIDAESLAALPSKPGVYTFEDAAGRPLYIGKSINIRSRVLSHLRNPEEARLLQQTQVIRFERTAGDIGAQLLESSRIKKLQPLHNKRLRRNREMCAIALDDTPPRIVYARDVDFAMVGNLFGLFATRRAAMQRLQTLVDMHRLCPRLCGLESARGVSGRCFASQLGRCAGACCGKESRQEHDERLRMALEDMRVMTWPYAGAVGIIEECDDLRQMHIVERWCYFGTVDVPAESKKAIRLTRKAQFDIDTYAILVRPLMLGQLSIVTQLNLKTSLRV